MSDTSAVDTPSAAYLDQLFNHFKLVHMIFVASKLGIADLLKTGPLTVVELAQATCTDECSLGRMLRTLASYGIFREDANSRFLLTPLAEHLRSDAPGNIRTQALFFGSEANLLTWANLAYSVRTGKPAFEHVYGKRLFEHLHEHPELAQAFNDMMTGKSISDGEAIVAAHDFAQYRRVVDIGGGHGAMLALILDQSLHSYGVLFDSPQVLASTVGAIDCYTANGRVEKVAGDFSTQCRVAVMHMC